MTVHKTLAYVDNIKKCNVQYIWFNMIKQPCHVNYVNYFVLYKNFVMILRKNITFDMDPIVREKTFVKS